MAITKQISKHNQSINQSIKSIKISPLSLVLSVVCFKAPAAFLSFCIVAGWKLRSGFLCEEWNPRFSDTAHHPHSATVQCNKYHTINAAVQPFCKCYDTESWIARSCALWAARQCSEQMVYCSWPPAHNDFKSILLLTSNKPATDAMWENINLSARPHFSRFIW